MKTLTAPDANADDCLAATLAGSAWLLMSKPRSSPSSVHPAATSAMLAMAAFVLVVSVVTQMRSVALSPSSPLEVQPRIAFPAGSPVAAPLPGPSASNASLATIAQADGSPHGDATRLGADISMDFQSMPRLEAARQLAGLTDAQVLQGRGLLYRAEPVTLRWRGHDPIEAWQRLLGENIRYAVHCNAGGCRVWILSLNGPEGAMFANGAADENVTASRETTTRAGTVDPIEPETAPVGPMNTPTPPDEHSESQSGEPDSTTPDPTGSDESGYTLTE